MCPAGWGEKSDIIWGDILDPLGINGQPKNHVMVHMFNKFDIRILKWFKTFYIIELEETVNLAGLGLNLICIRSLFYCLLI